MFNANILTADNIGNVYTEDLGTTFSGEAIKFIWKSPFLALGNLHRRKLIDEFYFVLDDFNNNSFDCSVYKDYDSLYSEDFERIDSTHFEYLIWDKEIEEEQQETPEKKYCWVLENETAPIWAIGTEVLEKAEEYKKQHEEEQICRGWGEE